MKVSELKEGTFYLVNTPCIKGRFQYAGPTHVGQRKYMFQLFATDLYLTWDEVMYYVEKDKTNANL